MLVRSVICAILIGGSVSRNTNELDFEARGVLKRNSSSLHYWPFKRRTSGDDSASQRSYFPEAKMTTVEIIRNRGYTAEVHSVTTDDGYILELHRIPYGKGKDRTVKRQPVLVQHGFLSSDNVWLILPSDQALAYTLADRGYDVWLGNSRGNTYSRKHVSLDPNSAAFWNWSVDEMGKYDQPAAIEYILAITGATTLSYIGHSQGCLTLCMAMNYRPQLNAKIDTFIAMAPAGSQANAETNIRVIAPLASTALALSNLIGRYIYEPNDSLAHTWRKTFCGANLFLRNTLCQNPIYSFTNDDYSDLDLNLLPVIDGQNPAGTSSRSPVFYTQNYLAGQTVQAFDYGTEENLKRYAQSKPPTYDFSKVTCPTYIFWAQNDKSASPKDVEWLRGKLGNVKAFNRIEDPNFNHGGFLFSRKVKELVYDRIFPYLPSTPST